MGRQNAFAEVHDPTRISPSVVGEFVKDNLAVAGNLTEYVTRGDVGSLDEIRAGSGAVVRQGLAKVAAYRDEEGELHLRSAVCTHAGCIVHWNDFEKCWDCPCHGSHFAPDGSVLQGPAVSPLARVDAPEEAAGA